MNFKQPDRSISTTLRPIITCHQCSRGIIEHAMHMLYDKSIESSDLAGFKDRYFEYSVTRVKGHLSLRNTKMTLKKTTKVPATSHPTGSFHLHQPWQAARERGLRQDGSRLRASLLPSRSSGCRKVSRQGPKIRLEGHVKGKRANGRLG
ncbi:hypothetical protein TWF694_004978 [Orbilia ellipsospora]|uniref:Uncharacterized protein n=1 Tax=Orbilia ellipsospora TaxID=2528407 RepID=A0AAV9WUH3_9PEZI